MKKDDPIKHEKPSLSLTQSGLNKVLLEALVHGEEDLRRMRTKGLNAQIRVLLFVKLINQQSLLMNVSVTALIIPVRLYQPTSV
ncbi:hypothetical protein Taro_036455 [Colocasia esculenta]|uniref:Uncharacterized protein n=1 Tax=Colocasia esculenta TaxID=4460 RepID=A0A843W1M5_COLES|nr:hypothetical protein [Colocasia esculenta]